MNLIGLLVNGSKRMILFMYHSLMKCTTEFNKRMSVESLIEVKTIDLETNPTKRVRRDKTIHLVNSKDISAVP